MDSDLVVGAFVLEFLVYNTPLALISNSQSLESARFDVSVFSFMTLVYPRTFSGVYYFTLLSLASD